MSTPVRLLGFGTALVAVFALSLFGARSLLPADLASSRDTAHQTEKRGPTWITARPLAV